MGLTRNQVLIVIVAVMASLLEIIDSSIVNVALPSMMGNLGATLEDISMVVTGYAIANAVVLPVSAWLGDRIGRRTYFLGCIMAFTITSVACGLAPNLTTLIIFRIFQGLMGGALLPTSQTLIYEQFPKEKAGMAGAIFGMSVMIGPTLGPVMGGYLTDQFGWRMIFNINLPLGILAFFIGMICIQNASITPEQQELRKQRKFDAMGLVFLVLGIGCLQFVLERGDADDWFASNLIKVCALTAAISLPAFVWWELKVKNPIINLRLFKQGVVVNGVLLMLFLGFFLYGAVFILPVFVTTSFHYDATQTGMLFIPGSILTAAMMPFVGSQMQRGTNPKLLIAVGLIMIEICCLLMTNFSPLTPRDEIMRSLYVRGFGMAFLFVPINSSILSQFSGLEMGEVSGLMNLFRQIGGSIGIALISTLLSTKGAQNYIDLASKVSLLNPNTQAAYYGSVSGMHSKMAESTGMVNATNAAIKGISGRMHMQVFMMSFNQLIWTIMVIFSFSFIPLYLLKFRKKPVVVMDSH